jgi:hypothetical protein
MYRVYDHGRKNANVDVPGASRCPRYTSTESLMLYVVYQAPIFKSLAVCGVTYQTPISKPLSVVYHAPISKPLAVCVFFLIRRLYLLHDADCGVAQPSLQRHLRPAYT